MLSYSGAFALVALPAAVAAGLVATDSCYPSQQYPSQHGGVRHEVEPR